MDDQALLRLFHGDYHDDRAAFERALAEFIGRSGRSSQLHRHALDPSGDLCVTAAQLTASEQPQRLLVLVTGIHGIEGYAGSAVLRLLLSDLLLATDGRSTGLLLVHALNPYGFAHFLRVNRHNVDLNRNCAHADEELRGRDDSAYRALAPLLAPKRPVRSGMGAKLQFVSRLLAARARVGELAVRRATLGGQYSDPTGVFWGGDTVQPELHFFQQLYEPMATRYREVLLIDLHTGYGDRAQAYALFGRADTPSIAACTAQGVRSRAGRELTYDVYGDLVQYCQQAARRLRPDGVFDGVALEVGTNGLKLWQQLEDLYTVVQENQARHHGAAEDRVDPALRRAFRELFYPSDPRWRIQALRSSVRAIEGMLLARGFISGLPT